MILAELCLLLGGACAGFVLVGLLALAIERVSAWTT